MTHAIYGPSIGNGSNARVAAGMCEGLRVRGKFAGFIPTDRPPEEWSTDALMARHAIYVGNPFGCQVMHHGAHEKRAVLLAPNSEWLPEQIISIVRGKFAVVCPSEWARYVLEGLGFESVTVWPHGLHDDFCFVDIHPDEEISLAHFSSSLFGRKGTRELLEAFSIGNWPDVTLDVFVEDAVARQLEVEYAGELRGVSFRSPLNGSAVEMASCYRSYSAVIQPSRGEAFGMIPLEARACGRPAILTSCTGHNDHAFLSGSVIIGHGHPAPLDDGPESFAPKVSPDAIVGAINEYRNHRNDYDKAAAIWARNRGYHWSWPETAGRWLSQRGR